MGNDDKGNKYLIKSFTVTTLFNNPQNITKPRYHCLGGYNYNKTVGEGDEREENLTKDVAKNLILLETFSSSEVIVCLKLIFSVTVKKKQLNKLVSYMFEDGAVEVGL